MASSYIHLRYLTLWIFMTTVACDVVPFRNMSLSWDARVKDLVDRLTVTEMMHQMARGGAGIVGGPAPPINRLNISMFAWNTDCSAGDVAAGNATSFPQPIGLAASFSRDLLYRVAEVTGVEVRAKYNNYLSKGMHGDHTGVSCFSPTVNIMRDPRWGRNQETYGEDPFLSGVLAANFIQGLQGNDSRYIRVSAGCKHFDAYGGPENIPESRYTFNANVSDLDWHMTFLPAFRQCVEAGTYGIMCSYNSINGVPSCANPKLLTDILRKEWGFKGYVVSDQGALESLVNDHKFVPNPVDAAAQSVNAGVSLETSSNQLLPVMLNLQIAEYIKLTSLDTIKERMKPLFYTRMRLGEFDTPEANPYSRLNLQNVLTPQHVTLSQQAAEKCFVLLKNLNSTLPLKALFYSKIALVGPMADNPAEMFGFYAAEIARSLTSTPRDILQRMGQTFAYAAGCTNNTCISFNPNEIEAAVTGADITFVALGTGQQFESAGNDRDTLSLPGLQMDLLKSAVQAAGGKPVILLLFTGGPVNIQWAEQSIGVAAILQMFYPGQTAGLALQSVLLNENGISSPASRLPFTWYAGDKVNLKMTDYSMVNRTYRFVDPAQPITYPFGYGLTYGVTPEKGIVYSDLTLPQSLTAGHDLAGSVTVVNQGTLNIDEVIQIYLSWGQMPVVTPKLQLVSFTRVTLTVGLPYTYKFIVPAKSLAIYYNGAWTVIPGTVQIYAGGQQPNQKKTIEYSNVVSQPVKINNYFKFSN